MNQLKNYSLYIVCLRKLSYFSCIVLFRFLFVRSYLNYSFYSLHRSSTFFIRKIVIMLGRHKLNMSFIRLYDGLRVGYQEWGAQHTQKVLAVHGWLDNSNSFKFLGPYLADRGFHVVAIDVIGHGHTDHLGVGAHYTIQKSASVAREVVERLGWSKSFFIGHSMVSFLSSSINLS